MVDTNYAGFWLRAVATFVDSLVVGVVSSILGWIFLKIVLKIIAAGVNGVEEQFFYLGIQFCVAFPYYVWGHFRYGTTLGKRLVGVFVVRTDSLEPITLKQSIGRFCAYAVSYLPVGCGYLMAAFHPQKRALHDLIAGTVCIKRG